MASTSFLKASLNPLLFVSVRTAFDRFSNFNKPRAYFSHVTKNSKGKQRRHCSQRASQTRQVSFLSVIFGGHSGAGALKMAAEMPDPAITFQLDEGAGFKPKMFMLT